LTDHTKQILDSLFAALDLKCAAAFVAGGAAVDIDKAGDIDLWFKHEHLTAAVETLNMMPIRSAVMKTDDGYGESGSNGILVGVGLLPDIIGLPIQVLTTNYSSIVDHLNGFDISTHMVAYDAGHNLTTVPRTTAPDMPPYVFKNHPKTLQRYIKICMRYGHTPNWDLLKGSYNGIISGTEQTPYVPAGGIPMEDWSAPYAPPQKSAGKSVQSLLDMMKKTAYMYTTHPSKSAWLEGISGDPLPYEEDQLKQLQAIQDAQIKKQLHSSMYGKPLGPSQKYDYKYYHALPNEVIADSLANKPELNKPYDHHNEEYERTE
jgi:hypothetical protein